jgi:Flp pilus assembly protein TadD
MLLQEWVRSADNNSISPRGNRMNTTTDSGTSLFLAILPTADSIQAQKTALANYQLTSGVKMLQNKRPQDAIIYFQRALALDSSNVDAYNDLGNTYLQLKQNDKAIETFQKLAKMKPFDTDAITSLGNAYAQAQQWSKAAAQYKKAVGLSPNNTTALYSLGQSYLLDKKYNDAISAFQKVIRLKPSDPNGYFGLGEAYNKTGNYDGAIKNLNKAIDLKHGTAFPQAVNELGYAYAGKGDDYNLQRTITKLQGMDSSLAAQLQSATLKPKFNTASAGSYNSFIPSLGPSTPLDILTLTDPNQTLSQPNASKSFTMDFFFNTDMDVASVQNVTNWHISKANGGKGGYYNYGYTPAPQLEAQLPVVQNVTYDVTGRKATVTFTLKQNATANAVIDPSHLVFSFSGQDVNGKKMDPTANAYDGVGGVFGAPTVSFYG